MILSKRDILDCLGKGTLKIDPPVSEDRIDSVSIDLALGRKFARFKVFPAHISAIRPDPSIWSAEYLWDRFEQNYIILEPNSFVLAQTLESVEIPPNLVGLLEGRSSLARLGITIHATAPKIDPGFSGPITLEIANFGSARVELRAEIDRPAQLMLLKVSSELEKEDLYEGTFQYQTDPIPR